MSHLGRGQLTRRTIAVVGAAALALIGTVSISSAASADPALSPANIIGTTGTLTIHKHAGDPGAAGNGQKITDPAAISALGDGLNGVVFSIQRVNYTTSGDTPVTAPINLTTDTGWDQAQGATPATVTVAPYSLTPQTTATTAEVDEVDGVAVVPNLPFGLYLVTETSPGTNPIVSPVQPFLVSVPYPDSTTSEWLYDVHVYPKNKLNTTTPTKTVAAPGSVQLGSSVTWTINAPVPALAADDTYDIFRVTDTLDARLTQVGSAVVKVNGGAALVEGTDYTEVWDAVTRMLTINFTGALDDLVANDNVTVEITTNVTSLGTGETAGKISNEGFVRTNDSTVKTNKEQTNWGPLKIVKHAGNQVTKTLKGAEFTLHESMTGPSLTPPGTLVSNDDGVIEVDGLWVGNGTTLAKTYYLQETKAPAGYALPTGNAAWTAVTVTAGSAASVVAVPISNTQQSGPNLPLTGSTGTAVFMAGGVALLLLAGGAALIASRRKQGHSAE